MITKWLLKYIQFATSITHRCADERLLEAGLEEGAQRALEVDHVEAVGQRDRVAPVGDPAHDLVPVVGDEEEDGLAQQVAPATGQASAEAGGGRCGRGDARALRIVNGA